MMENKRKIDEYIPKAIDSLSKNKKIVINGEIKSGFAGQIATFSVAVSTGSLLSAVAFFSEKKQSAVERQELMNVIYEIITGEGASVNDANNSKAVLLSYVKEKYKQTHSPEGDAGSLLDYGQLQQDILNAAIAVKLAINFFPKAKENEGENGR